MANWGRVVASGIISAIFAGFLFWFINSIHQVNGVGLLRRQEWPVSSLWSWIAFGAAFGMVGTFANGVLLAHHARKTRDLAEELGREYTESYSLPPESSSMPIFDGWSNGRHAMFGCEGDVAVTVFDYTTITKGGE